jgi:hypothetical protein
MQIEILSAMRAFDSASTNTENCGKPQLNIHRRTSKKERVDMLDIDELVVEINELWLLYRWHFDLTCDSGIADTETA